MHLDELVLKYSELNVAKCEAGASCVFVQPIRERFIEVDRILRDGTSSGAPAIRSPGRTGPMVS